MHEDDEPRTSLERTADAEVADLGGEVEYELIDVTGDGQPDAIVARSSKTYDIDGDGTDDVVENVQAVAIDFSGDGKADIIQTTTTVGMDIDGDGKADSLEVTRVTKIRQSDGTFQEVEVVHVDETIVDGTAAPDGNGAVSVESEVRNGTPPPE